MPSKSKAQHNFMAAVANNPTFAKKVGVPQSVGKDFSNADKNRKTAKGDDMKSMKKMASGGISNAKMGSVRTAAPSKDGLAAKGKTKGTMVKMSGSKPLGMKRGGKTC
jgi:hypothetical protein